jgi:hypothetical protein
MEKDMNENTNLGKVFLSEYYSSDNKRTAQIHSTWRGYEVDFLTDGVVTHHQQMWDKTRRYAEDACENWVEGIIK